MTAAYKKLFYTGIFAYAALLVLTIVFFKEKAFFSDNAYVLFNLLKDGHIRIYHFRFVEVFTEGIAWLAIKLHAPLGAVACLYAISFYLFQFVCYLLCGLWLRQYRPALVLLLVNILFVSDSFYWAISELPMGISLLLLLYAIVTARGIRYHAAYTGVAALLIASMAFAHLLLLFPLVYATLFFYLEKEQPVSRKVLLMIPVIYAAVLVLKIFFFHEPYDQHATGGLRHFITLFPDYFTTWSFRRFFINLGGKFIWITLLTAGITAFYITRRQWWLLLLFLLSMAGYVLLTNVSYPGSDTGDSYIENLYYPLAVFLALPFVFHLLPVLMQRRQAIPVVVLIVLTGIVRIWHTHTPYTARLHWQQGFLQQHRGEKLLVSERAVPMDTVLMSWATPYEFALLSTAQSGTTQSFTILDTASRFRWAAGEQKKIVTQWGNIDYSELPASYFHFPDTVNGYRLVE